ncbi:MULTISPECIES: LysM peptidoglycan-binding domain-containing protein [unclassified Granulicatella]|uniref:LysM peptidoglycan-binding domain-containing protein n=1 Tax=unclassified Granulicatella TaxID=2630493 RepID=UPI0010738FA1|nr:MULTISPECIES: LysM peptidoglycan-binding domain-containing protein [unclassified Granulicatella]MBF0780631.1 LysM peptidoglycan-binding domain-containing protein [Granulicatella sp. 19428wC4_WM01]TFU94589.1 LysM peptidoglycan-binding domain-containing protein [Granulicatella sp. WM01]
MKLVRRQARRYKTLQDKKMKKSAAIGATVALSQMAMMSTEFGAHKTAYAASAQQAFINDIAPLAQELAGNNDLYASVMIAQAILESSWGTSTLATVPNYNLFGIKGSYNGESATMLTLEDNGSGQYYSIHAAFRKYPSYYESLQDYVNLLKSRNIGGTTFYRGAWKSQTSSYRDATQWLTGRYATDTAYATKLNNIIERYQLEQYDTKVSGTYSENTSSVLNDLSVNGQYIVKAGDTLWSIANKANMTVNDLKTLNALSSDAISVGQVLKLSTSIQGLASVTSVNEVSSEPTVTPIVTTESKPVVTPTVQISTSVTHYTVKAGDTLWRISNRYGLTVSELKQLNGLTSDLILVGQVLRVNEVKETTPVVSVTSEQTVKPVSEATSKPTVTPVVTTESKPVVTPTVQTSTSVTHYTVKAGDTLWRISNRYGLSVSELKQLNGLTSDLILVGQVLRVNEVKETTPVVSVTSEQTVKPVSEATSKPTITPVVTTESKPVVTPTVQTSTSVTHYTVKAGDTLWRISNRHGLSVSELKQLNGLTSDMIYVGQTLRINASTQEMSTNVSSSSSHNVHIVKSGETLWRISNRYGLSVSELKQLNGLTSDLILVGQTLTLN